MTTALSWVGVDLLSGRIVADLPDIALTGPLPRTIGQSESVSVNLNITATTNPDWTDATQHGGAALIAYTGDADSPVIVWGGIVQQRFRDPASPTVMLALVTAEAYLDGCYITSTLTATNVNQDTIVADLMAYASGAGQVPIALNHLPNASTQVQSIAYDASSQTSVYAALQALSGVTDGPEWTIDWMWDTATGIITPTLSYGARIGMGVMAGAQPSVTVEARDMQSGSGLTEDYSPGQGANVVTAWGSASGTDTGVPLATATAPDTAGRPLWAYGYSPSQQVSDPTVLGTYAAAAVTAMADGAQPVTLVIANNIPGKVFGSDWGLGDDIGWVMTGPAFPEPISGVSRCIGYSADLTTITPILRRVS